MIQNFKGLLWRFDRCAVGFPKPFMGGNIYLTCRLRYHDLDSELQVIDTSIQVFEHETVPEVTDKAYETFVGAIFSNELPDFLSTLGHGMHWVDEVQLCLTQIAPNLIKRQNLDVTLIEIDLNSRPDLFLVSCA